MKRGLASLTALLCLTVFASALEVEPVYRPVAAGGYTYHAIDEDGTLYAWGDSMHGAVTIGDMESDPEWENAVVELENAVFADSGFSTSLAVDADGVLWGWGWNHAGKLCGQDASHGAVPLMEDVVSAYVYDTSCSALKKDGSLWVWGGVQGEIIEPKQVLTGVRWACGNFAVLGDGTLVYWPLVLSGGQPVPMVSHVAQCVACESGLLVLGEDGNLYRIPGRLIDGVFSQPELMLEDVVSISYNCCAVTADGTLWSWGQNDRPAVLKNGKALVPTEEEKQAVEMEIPIPITSGVRYAESGGNYTLAVMEDGSLWKLPDARTVEYVAVGEGTGLTEPVKLLDKAGEVTLFVGDPNAPAPVLLEFTPEDFGIEIEGSEPQDGGLVPEETLQEEPEALEEAPDAEVPAGETHMVSPIAVSLLPLIAAVIWHLWKRRKQ